MIHVFKKGGKFKDADGNPYTCKCIKLDKKPEHIKDGWVDNLEALKSSPKAAPKKKTVSKKTESDK